MIKHLCNVNQGFGENANPFYAAQGIKGHSGVDESCGYGSEIKSQVDMLVYKVVGVRDSGPEGYTAIFGIVDNGIECFEFQVGHCDPKCSEGQRVKVGDVIGTEANHGQIYSGGVRITLYMQAHGDKRGAHRHIQKRPLKKVKRTTVGKQYLTTIQGGFYLDQAGYYYEVYDYGNGYNGCTDWSLPTINRPLTLGSSGYDVEVLQRLAVKMGIATFEPTGYFGPLTLSALLKMQAKFGLIPAPVVGPRTRAIISNLI